MNAKERELAEAAANMTVEDFQCLQSHGMIPEVTERSGKAEEKTSSQEGCVDSSSSTQTRKKGERRHIEHEWPEVGTILEADYYGEHYEAEVVAAPQYQSDKAVRILSGPSAGKLCRSLSGAMLKATEDQRQEQALGNKGVANGWAFWKAMP